MEVSLALLVGEKRGGESGSEHGLGLAWRASIVLLPGFALQRAAFLFRGPVKGRLTVTEQNERSRN